MVGRPLRAPDDAARHHMRAVDRVLMGDREHFAVTGPEDRHLGSADQCGHAAVGGEAWVRADRRPLDLGPVYGNGHV